MVRVANERFGEHSVHAIRQEIRGQAKACLMEKPDVNLRRAHSCGAGMANAVVARLKQEILNRTKFRTFEELITDSIAMATATAAPVEHGFKDRPRITSNFANCAQAPVARIAPLRSRTVATAESPKVTRGTFVKGSLVICSAAMAEQTLEAEAGSSSKTQLEALPFKPEGYNFWKWRDHKVHYVVQGEGRPIVLIHGFGASVYHWRYNIPQLAKAGFKVYAMDLLGFGWTDKALVDYNSMLWRDQVADFVTEVVGEPAVLVGNSIGGFTVLLTAATRPDVSSGLALLNASGQFESADSSEDAKIMEAVDETVVGRLTTQIKTAFRRVAIALTFWQAKQPARVKSVLQSVYKDQTNVDDYLINSILQPTRAPNSGEVYYRLMSQMLSKPSIDLSLNTLLKKLECPLLLLWGDLDPWMGATKADKIKELYPSATLKRLQAGHCPHDEAPEAANAAIVEWMQTFGQVPSA
ncbi:hypothetical protein R1sor_020026 [Riccia sorocarpa]|uniref:AB hydrolase-1 domain-containing protein n=1 Tax=Riccia sorocarpa TaxID=122646 RepID=A0ABD3IKG1_9MARC